MEATSDAKNAINEVLAKTGVILPLYDVEELNEIVVEYNNGEMSLHELVGTVWNKAYCIGAVEAFM